MTLDEAIVHSEEKAKEHERKLKMYKGINEARPLFREEGMACKLCAEEHRQLVEWLKELKQIRNALDKIRTEIDSYCSENRDRNDGLYIAMKIIDKYKAESEDKE